METKENKTKGKKIGQKQTRRKIRKSRGREKEINNIFFFISCKVKSA
jgi:hypothetical protein